jgi:hypothetical protein
MKINNSDWYPCYLNPDFSELEELANSHWDTVRILIIDEPRKPEIHNQVIMASGYGNTHETLARTYRSYFKLKRTPFNYDFILYKRDGRAWFNDLTAGQDKVSVEEMLRSFTNEQARMFKDLLALSNLEADS